MTVVICPRCHTLLASVLDRPQEMECATCQGTFVAATAEEAARSNMADASKGRPLAGTVPLGPNVPRLPCPACLTHLQPADAGGVFVCPACAGRWSDSAAQRLAEPALPPDRVGADRSDIVVAPDASPLLRKILYGVSLPERLLRSGVGLTAGAVKELGALLVPQAFQSSKSYQIAIHDSLSFLTETVGGVSGPPGTADKASEHVARKAIGNFVDLAGLATLHVSPMWLLAITSDLAYGGRTYVLEVARALEEQGLIDETSTIHNVDDLLDALQRSCGTAAGALDKPPMSVDELRSVVAQTRQEISGMDVTSVLPEAELRRLWGEMQDVATQEGVGLLEISTAMTMSTLDRVATISSGALTSIQVAGGLLNRSVLDHYRQSLTRIQTQGFYNVLDETYRPYAEAVWNNFSSERKSWTESLLDPDNVSTVVGKLFSFLERKTDPDGGP